MRKKERYEKILAWFRENVPVAETELHYDNPFELLIAVILSAQCTDKRVNMITPALYRDFPTPEALAATTPDVVYEYIRSVSYPNNKAKHLVGMAQMLVKEFNSEVPDTLEELVKHIPETDIPIAHHWLILHGRYVCQARTPQCDTCGLQLMCKYYCQKYKVSKESGKDKE